MLKTLVLDSKQLLQRSNIICFSGVPNESVCPSFSLHRADTGSAPIAKLACKNGVSSSKQWTARPRLTLTIFSYIFYGWANPWGPNFLLARTNRAQASNTARPRLTLGRAVDSQSKGNKSPFVTYSFLFSNSRSRNGSLTLCSGFSVFKNPRIIDK